MSGRAQFKRLKPIIDFCSAFLGLFGRKINTQLFILFRNVPFKLGLFLRYILLKNIAKKVGVNVSIQPQVYLYNIDKIEFGNNVSIHPMCYIEGAGGIEIGDNVSIAHSSTLITTNHSWNDVSIPIKYNPEKYSKIILEDDIWIGCGVRILSGVQIKQRSVVAAGAVVTKSFERNTLIGGVPAKQIKKINEDQTDSYHHGTTLI